MNNVTIFWLQLLSSCVVCAIVVAWYVWPSLTKRSRNAALIPPVSVHVMRYVGMTLLVTGMIDPTLPRDFVNSAAYGDLIAAALALASLFALRGNWGIATPLVWVFNTWGFVDLLNGVRGRLAVERPEFQPGYCLVYLYVLRSCGDCFTFDDLLDFGQVQALEEISRETADKPESRCVLVRN